MALASCTCARIFEESFVLVQWIPVQDRKEHSSAKQPFEKEGFGIVLLTVGTGSASLWVVYVCFFILKYTTSNGWKCDKKTAVALAHPPFLKQSFLPVVLLESLKWVPIKTDRVAQGSQETTTPTTFINTCCFRAGSTGPSGWLSGFPKASSATHHQQGIILWSPQNLKQLHTWISLNVLLQGLPRVNLCLERQQLICNWKSQPYHWKWSLKGEERAKVGKEERLGRDP